MLNKIRIVDFSRYIPGPFATQRLADMGAEVIKVEPPKSGDPARLFGDHLNGTGIVFLANNRNKKSVTINLKEPAGRELAFQLASQADVVIEGFRPGVADALGIGYESLKHIRPKLIYCSLTGYGQTGPLRDLGGHDLNYMALSGVLSQLKDQEGRPVQPAIQFSDLIGGIAASEAILAALVKMQMTGEGSYLDISITDSMIGMMTGHVMIQQVTGNGSGVPELGGSLISYFIYETKDNRFVSLGALEKKFWENFCLAVGREDWIGDHLSPAVEKNLTFLELKALFKTRTFAEWSRFSREVDCCMAPVLDTGEMIQHPHVKEKRLVSDIQCEEWGTMFQTATSAGGFDLWQLKSVNITSPPILAQHNHEIFLEVLNATPDEIEEWERQGVI